MFRWTKKEKKKQKKKEISKMKWGKNGKEISKKNEEWTKNIGTRKMKVGMKLIK